MLWSGLLLSEGSALTLAMKFHHRLATVPCLYSSSAKETLSRERGFAGSLFVELIQTALSNGSNSVMRFLTRLDRAWMQLVCAGAHQLQVMVSNEAESQSFSFGEYFTAVH